MMTLLVGLPPAPVDKGRVALADKTVSGLRAIADRWPGRVVATLTQEQVPATANLGMAWRDLDSLGFDLEARPLAEAVERVAPDVVQLPLAPHVSPVLGIAPAVVVAENTALMKFQYAALTAPRRHLPRMLAGALRQEAAHRAVARRAAGVACNGWGAWRAYGRRRAGVVEPVLFFDNRIASTDLGPVRPAQTRRPGRDLTLAFSGRLHPSKGPGFAIDASRALDVRGQRHVLHVLGDGPLDGDLRRAAGSSVRFHGDLPFREQWIPFVRNNVDMMLLPHVQGDPSGTYLECAALGVPVLGFDNAAMRGHEEHGGFAVRAARTSGEALADLVEELWEDHDRLAGLSNAGTRFLGRENMDEEFDRRVQQLLEVATRAV